MYCTLVPKERGEKEEESNGNATFLKPEKTFCKKMGCGKDKLMAQQVQKTVHTYEKKAENYLGLYSSPVL